jgi:hypothetical protein
MNVVSRAETVATAEWSDLLGELDRWGDAGRLATFWWRDDDAEAMTPQLGRLLALAGPAPLALAAIPARASPDLETALARFPHVAVLQHGWNHANHARTGKKSEFPAGRPSAEIARDLAAGRDRLKAIFDARAVAVFVPPWNRVAPEFTSFLRATGFAALSVMAPRQGTLVEAGLKAIDVHVDLVAWKRGRGFIGSRAALGGLVAELRARRGDSDGDMAPIGILTHHLVMDDAAADFLGELRKAIEGHRAARWADIRELLQ